MRRALGRGGWALSITAGLTLTVAATAQPPASAPPAASKPPQQSTAARTPVTEDVNRTREIAVELNWLADPVTFPYQLGARVNGQALEIRGYVPSASVRDRAVKVACQNCPLPVVDRLTVRPEVAAPSAGVRVEQLQPAAVAALKAAFPRQAAALSVQCRPYGQVLLSGPVSSPEEKLAISASLRHLPGCTSVVNQLEVGGSARQPAPTTGRTALISSHSQVPAQGAAVKQAAATTALPVPPRELPTPTVQRNNGPAVSASPYNSMPAPSNAAAAWPAPAGGKATAQPQSASPYQGTWPATAQSTYNPRPVLPGPQKVTAASALPTLERTSERPVAAARPQTASGALGTALPLAPAPSASSARLPQNNSVLVPVSGSVVKGPAPQQTSTNNTVVQAQHLTWAGQADRVTPVSNVVRGPAPQTAPLRPAVPSVAKVPPAGEPYVATGVVLISEPDPTAKRAVPAPQKTPLQAVQAACPAAKKLEVVVRRLS